MADENLVHIVCGLQGEKLAPMAAVCIRSLLDSSDPNGRLRVSFLYSDIEGGTREKLERSWQDSRLVVHWIDAAEALAPVSNHPLKGALLRLFIGELLGDECRRVIWLDLDLMVFADIGELWTTSLEGRTVGAVPDPLSDTVYCWADALRRKAREIGRDLRESHRYFNSGVLLIDLERWRSRDIGRRCFEIFLANPQLTHLDQDVLNLELQGDTTYLPLKWNLVEIPTLLWEWDPKTFTGLKPEEGVLAPAIRHMAGLNKPWHLGIRHSVKRAYYGFLDKTEWRGQRPAPSFFEPLITLIQQWMDFQWLILRGFWWPGSHELRSRCFRMALRRPWLLPATGVAWTRRLWMVCRRAWTRFRSS